MGDTFLRVHDKNVRDEIEITINTHFHTTTTIPCDIASRSFKGSTLSASRSVFKIIFYFILQL